MSTAPLDEVLVIITNALRKSTEGQMFFEYTEEGEQRFGKWQDMILKAANVIHDSWNDESDICERAITTFEKVFSTPFTIKEHAQ